MSRTILSKRHNFKARFVAWSPDGTRIASAGFVTIRLWDAATGGRLCWYDGHHLTVTALAWSPDSTRLASAEDDGTLHVWSADTGRQILHHHWNLHRAHAPLPVSALAWSPDGRYLASMVKAAGYPVHLWDVTTGQ